MDLMSSTFFAQLTTDKISDDLGYTTATDMFVYLNALPTRKRDVQTTYYNTLLTAADLRVFKSDIFNVRFGWSKTNHLFILYTPSINYIVRAFTSIDLLVANLFEFSSFGDDDYVWVSSMNMDVSKETIRNAVVSMFFGDTPNEEC